MLEGKKKPVQWTFKLLKHTKSYLVTEVGLSTFIAALSILIITLVLSSRYLMINNGFLNGGVSTRNITAERTLHLEDTESTQQLRYEARQQIAPIYKKESGEDKAILDNIAGDLDQIEAIRDKAGLSYADKAQQVRELYNGQSSLPDEVIRTLLTTPHWQKLYETSIQASQALLQRGITFDDYHSKKEVLIRENIPAQPGITIPEEDAVIALVGNTMHPTLLIDEKSTEEARDIAASHVKPIVEVYHKGDLIIKKGDRINALQRAALIQQGDLFYKNRWLTLFGISILSISLLSIVWVYLYRFEHSNFFKPTYASLLAVTMLASVVGISLVFDLQANDLFQLLPVSIMALMLCLFTHPRIAILTTMMIILLCGLVLQIPLEALSILVISSLAGILILARKPVPKDRGDLIIAGLGVGVTSGVMILALSFIYAPGLGIEQPNLLYQIGTGVVCGSLTGVLTLGALPIFESWFKLVTPYTLLELGNHDRPILRRMQMEAPGTFHHSLMVATLSEAAAEAIGANPILARVGSLYHDIGKIKRPLFFVENQAYFGVENPHDKLTPRLSKMVITAHPRDGIEMGKHLGLPKSILRFMPEHHGTLIAGYFYNKAILEEGEENVNKAQFRYPGPKPQSKETAIVMLADACESAVRALKNPTINQVEERVDKIIKQRIDDNQFSECTITFQDIQVIRETFIRILRGIQHNRIEYQQNILQELGKKSAQMDASVKSQPHEPPKEMSPKSVAFHPAGSLPSASSELAPQPSQKSARSVKLQEEPLIELDSLSETLQSQDTSRGPDCC